jgi:hypothetical protein
MAKLTTIALLCALILAIPLASCSSEGAASSAVDTSQEVCPDSFILVNKACLSSSLGTNNKPVGDARSFGIDTTELFCSFEVYEDICCSTVIVHWIYGGEIIDFWQGYSTIPPYVSLKSPEEGLIKGDYTVVMYIGVREVMRVPFTIV